MSAYLPIGVTFFILGFLVFEGPARIAFLVMAVTFVILAVMDKNKKSDPTNEKQGSSDPN